MWKRLIVIVSGIVGIGAVLLRFFTPLSRQHLRQHVEQARQTAGEASVARRAELEAEWEERLKNRNSDA